MIQHDQIESIRARCDLLALTGQDTPPRVKNEREWVLSAF
jgi:hypothetical protein